MNAAQQRSHCQQLHPLLRGLWVRAVFLFLNFLLIITALYHLKPASRSLYIEFLGADRLPYVWIGTALLMAVTIGAYHRLVERVRRVTLVLGSCLLFALAFIGFWFWLRQPGPAAAFCLYVLVDVFSVVLVEQFWSLTNSIYSTREGKSWYGFIAIGGLLGGILGGTLSSGLVTWGGLGTADLLLVAAAILGLVLLINLAMNRAGLYCEVEGQGKETLYRGGWQAIRRNRYLLMIAVILLLAQVVDPLVEFQFSKSVEAAFPLLDQRTVYLGWFFSLLGWVSILVNLLLTPLIHRLLGVTAGLLVQPLMLLCCSGGFLLRPTLLLGAATKIADRGLSYSINRASRELLYIPIDTVLIYRAKAWIDMFGYRLFKIGGSLLILGLTPWISLSQLSWVVLALCLVWIATVLRIGRAYGSMSGPPSTQDRV